MKKSINWIVPLLMVFGLGLYGCTDRFRADGGEMPSGETHAQTHGDGEWIPYTMDFEASDMITPSLRSLTEEQENEIKSGSVRVLVFNTSDNKFAYEAPVTSITPTSDKKNGKVQLLLKNTDDAQYRFVMLANLQSNTPNASDFEGKTYFEVVPQFRFNIPSNGKWSGSDLPMWGEITAVVDHNSGANPKIGTIKLIRSVARVDVGLNLSGTKFNEVANGIGDIQMKSIKFFNINKIGFVPARQTEDSTPENPKASITIPSFYQTYDKKNVVELDFSTDIKNGNLLQRCVYIPETSNVEQVEEGSREVVRKYDQRPFMVVGLVGADKKAPQRLTYFRIDFLERAGEEATATYKYLSLLRNYRYLVNITNVGGPGFDSVDDAKQGPAANIMYNVVVWNESEMSNVKYDGQYMLGVSEDHLKFYHDGGEIKIKAQTSWPGGLKVPQLPNWVTVTKVPVHANKTKPTDEHYLIFKVKDPTAQPRKGKGYVQAGRIRWNLEFEQTNMIDVHIDIFSDADCTQPLQFSEINQFGEKYDPNNENKSVKIGTNTLTAEKAKATLTFYVKTAPQNLKPEILGDSFSKFKFSDPFDMGQGIWRYTVTAKDITANDIKFESFTDSFEFKITHKATKQSAQARLTLLQKEYDAIPFGEKELHTNLIEDPDGIVYLLDGSTQSFFMQANTDYQLKMTSNISNNKKGKLTINEVPLTIINNNPTMGGTQVDFKAVDDLQYPKLFAGRVKYELTSPTGKFPKKEFYIVLISAIRQPEANTYMIKAGAKQGILIPASRVNTARKYYETLLNLDTDYFSGAKDSDKLPGTKEEFMLNELAADDDFSVNIVWTDMYAPGAETKTKRAGLKALGRVGKGGPSSHIFVMAGDQPGNVLISIRSNKIEGRPILWSWHIWIVKDYPKVVNLRKIDVLKKRDLKKGHWNYAPSGVSVMDHLLGAEKAPVTYGSTKPDEHGFQYQWGRKDPFPAKTILENGHKIFYDGEGRVFDFLKQQKGDKANFGEFDAINATGGSLSMRGSIENPASIVSHRQLWQFENFPWTSNFTYKGRNKYTFRYPWNRYDDSINHMNADGESIRPDDYSIIGGKTVFDPCPYGFRIMSYGEAVLLRKAYWNSWKNEKDLIGLPTPYPGWIYDGSYSDGGGSGTKVMYAVSSSRDTQAGYYLLFTSDWSDASNDNADYKRANGFSVRPVVDPEHYGAENLTEKDYTKYLPDYNVNK